MLRSLFGRSRAAAARPAAPVQAIAPQTPRLLTAADFAPSTPNVGQLSRLAAFEVPRGEILELDTVRPFRLLIKAIAPVTVTTSETGTATIDLGALGFDLVQSARPAPTLPNVNSPNVIVRNTGGAKVMISAINYTANTVGVSGLATEASVELVVYALTGNGEVKLRAIQPAGVDQRSVELYNDTLSALHEVDQAYGETAPVLQRGLSPRVALAPKWLLAVEVDAPIPYTFVAASEPVLQIHGYRVPVNVTQSRELSDVVAARMRR